MNKETINEIAKQFGIAIDWTQKNVMPQISEVVNRYAEYRVLVDTIWCVLFAVAIVIVITGVAFWTWKNRKYLDGTDVVLALFISFIPFVLSVVGFACCLDAVIGWKVCPEIMLLNSITGNE